MAYTLILFFVMLTNIYFLKLYFFAYEFVHYNNFTNCYYYLHCVCFFALLLLNFIFIVLCCYVCFRVSLFLLWLLFSSDDFIQAQQQLARWASEDVVSVVVLDQHQQGTMSDSQQQTGVGQLSTATTSSVIHHHGDPTALMGSAVTNGISVGQRDYYPSPPSTETESSGSVIQPLPSTQSHLRRVHIDTNQQQQHPHTHPHQQQIGDEQLMENGRYPEYKHW